MSWQKWAFGNTFSGWQPAMLAAHSKASSISMRESKVGDRRWFISSCRAFHYTLLLYTIRSCQKWDDFHSMLWFSNKLKEGRRREKQGKQNITKNRYPFCLQSVKQEHFIFLVLQELRSENKAWHSNTDPNVTPLYVPSMKTGTRVLFGLKGE